MYEIVQPNKIDILNTETCYISTTPTNIKKPSKLPSLIESKIIENMTSVSTSPVSFIKFEEFMRTHVIKKEDKEVQIIKI